MKTKIRPAIPEDAADACEVLLRSISECCVEDHRNDEAILSIWLGNKTPATVQKWIECQGNHSFVAVSGERLVGMAAITRQGKIVLCYVAPKVRFTGIGKALLLALEDQAREWGLAELQVASTLTASPFYARNGYLASGITTTPFGTEATSFSKRLAGSYARKSNCRCGQAA